jgi:hypothetical protein
LLIGMTGTCFGQGTVYWAGLSAAAITAQTNTQRFSQVFGNGGTNPGTIGYTAPASSGLAYYYELLYNTNFTGSQAPTPDAAALLGTWLETGLTATNHRNTAGWLLPVNPNIAAVVPWAPWTTNNIMLVGWSANLGTSWAAVKIKLANWDYYSSSITGEAFFGESATGYITPGIANPSPMVFGTGPTANGLPIYSQNMQLYWLPPPATAAPVIVGQPTNQNVRFGTTANFSVGAVSAAPMTYQWFFGTNAVLETTNSTLCLTNVQPSQAGSYTVVVTNVYGAATSAPAMLTVSAEPIIEDSPTNQQAMAGDTVNFSVVAVGALPMAYQWFFATNAVLETTNSILCLTNVQPWQEGAYTVVITNVYGAATSAPAMLTVTGAPVIEAPPAGQQAFVGDTVNFSVPAVGGRPFAYQWFFGTDAILRATNSVLQLTNVQPRQTGAYTVVITNIYGAATSTPAMLEVYPVVTVTNCTEADLRAAVVGGAKVTLACDGTISLTSTITNKEDVLLDGRGHNVTISGNNAVRVFVVGTNGTLTLNHLTIANGIAFDYGGGLLNLGTVNASDCTFSSNTVTNQFLAVGGAIYNDGGGTMNLDLCRFTGNGAVGGGNGSVGGSGVGGAIFNSGTLVVRRSSAEATLRGIGRTVAALAARQASKVAMGLAVPSAMVAPCG